jgi:hypothetical protein
MIGIEPQIDWVFGMTGKQDKIKIDLVNSKKTSTFAMKIKNK